MSKDTNSLATQHGIVSITLYLRRSIEGKSFMERSKKISEKYFALSVKEKVQR